MMEVTLQINDEVSWEKVSAFLAPYIERADIKEAPKKIWKNDADWIGGHFKSESFVPLKRDEIYDR
jgi:hypothetical protein